MVSVWFYFEMLFIHQHKKKTCYNWLFVCVLFSSLPEWLALQCAHLRHALSLNGFHCCGCSVTIPGRAMYFSTSASHLQTHVSLLTSLCPACAGHQKETQEVTSTCDNAAKSACCASLEPPSGAPFNNGTAVRDTSLIAVVVFQMTDWLTIQRMADFSFFCFVLFSRSLLFSIQQPSCRDRSGLNGFKGHYDRK